MSADELTLEWVAKAEEDAAVAEREARVRKAPSPGAVCYHAQQAIEKYVKAVLQQQGHTIPRTHDLPTLHALCEPSDRGLLIDRDGLVGLTRYGTRFRYPGEFADRDDAKQALALMRRYREAFRSILGLHT